jgi:hypothetical protein
MNSKPTFVHSGLLRGLLPTVRQGGGRGDPKGRLFLNRTGLDGCVRVSYCMCPHTDTYTGWRAEITIQPAFLRRLTPTVFCFYEPLWFQALCANYSTSMFTEKFRMPKR